MPGERRGSAPPAPTTAALTAGDVVERAADVLRGAGVADPASQAREIVGALLDAPRHWAALQRHTPAEQALLDRALAAAQCLARGMPFQYAVGRASFRGLTLHVDERVLIPRPETERLVDLVLDATGDVRGGVAVDVGTGSGAIALALAQEGTFDRVIATDVSRDALTVARHNATVLAAALGAPVEFRLGSLLAPVAGERARAIVSNPPYIAFEEAAALPAAVRNWEPPLALLSADNGMAVTRRLVREAPSRLPGGGVLALEIDARRAALVAEMVSAQAGFTDVSVRLDLAGRERYVIARRRELT